jgi:hypothetical protein
MRKRLSIAVLILILGIGYAAFTLPTVSAEPEIRPDNSWLVTGTGPGMKRKIAVIPVAYGYEHAVSIFRQQYPMVTSIDSVSRRSFVDCEVIRQLR